MRVSGLAAATLMAYVLAVLFGAIALLVGCLTGHRALAAGVASGAALAAYLLTSIAALVAGLKPFRPLSPFWWYSGNDPLRHGLDPLHVGLLVGRDVGLHRRCGDRLRPTGPRLTPTRAARPDSRPTGPGGSPSVGTFASTGAPSYAVK